MSFMERIRFFFLRWRIRRLLNKPRTDMDGLGKGSVRGKHRPKVDPVPRPVTRGATRCGAERI